VAQDDGDDGGTLKLTAAMAAGDQDAVARFYGRYFDWLYAQARRATRRDEAFCLDVVQDAVLRIVRTVRSAKSAGQFHAWMRLVVRTTALDKLRGENSRIRRETAVVAMRASDGGMSHDDAPPFDDSDLAQRQWLADQIRQCDPRIVQLIELRYEKNWTLRRIATFLGLSVGTIDGRLRRAINDLRLRAMKEFDD
jgi:RNA polymerase sigma factor (sigma-70 family)